MLAQLKTVHDDVLAALAGLEPLTAAPELDEVALSAARVRLSRASGRRRRIVDEAVSRLLPAASAANAQKLRDLRERNATQLEASTRHIGLWGMRDIRADWPGYCDASRGMRQWMRDLIAADREILYPLLQQVEG